MDKIKLKALLLDTNASSYPIYKALIKLGFEVYTVGNNPNDYLCSFNNYIQLDYSDINQISKIVRRKKISKIIPGCNDLSYKVASNIVELFPSLGKISNPIITDTLNNKQKFKEFAIQNNIPVAKSIDQLEIDESKFPLIIKPSDSYSGQGVTAFKEPVKEVELKKAIKLAKRVSNENSCLIEEFLEGQLYSHSCFIENHQVVKDFIVIERGKYEKFSVDSSYLISSSNFKKIDELREVIRKISKSLELTSGLIHSQFILNENGEFKLIEVTRRCPGDLYSLLIQKSTNVDYSMAYVKYILGLNYTFETSIRRNIIRHTLKLPEKEVFFSLNILNQKGIKSYQFKPYVKIGFKNNSNKYVRIGIIFIEVKRPNEMDRVFDLLINDGILLLK